MLQHTAVKIALRARIEFVIFYTFFLVVELWATFKTSLRVSVSKGLRKALSLLYWGLLEAIKVKYLAQRLPVNITIFIISYYSKRLYLGILDRFNFIWESGCLRDLPFIFFFIANYHKKPMALNN